MVAWGTIAAATIKGASKALTKGSNTATKTAEQAIENTAQNIGATVASDAIGAVAVIVLGGVVITSQVGIGALHAGNTVRGWLKNPLSLLMSDSQAATINNGIGQSIANQALTWAGKDFNPGVSAQCAFFVHEVLRQKGIDIPAPSGLSWDGLRGGSEGLAAMFFHDDVGVRIPVGHQQPGDLVAFANTYGDFPQGAITHIGIWVGNGKMIDRPTASAPVKHRVPPWPVAYVVRPHAYAQQASVGGDFYSRYKSAIAQQESSGNPTLVNQDSGALGLYQFMPETLADLATSCVGYQPSHSEFLGNVALQDQIMDCYLDSAKPRITATDEMTKCRQHASHHYSGDPNKYANTARQTYGGNSYPSIADYTISVCSKL